MPVTTSDETKRAAQAYQVRRVTIEADAADQRIDNFLLRELKGVPRSHVYRLCRSGQVRVNGGRVKPSYRLQAGDEVRIPPVRMAQPKPVAKDSNLAALLERCIVYEDKYLLVLNKPTGVAVHGGSGIALGAIEAMRAQRPKSQQLELIHRIDRATSGLLLIAKTRAVLRQAHELFREDRVDKRYFALVKGEWPAKLKRINANLEKNILQSGERMVRVSETGKYALTEFKIQQRLTNATLLDIKLRTGRTHQIRVHTQHAGHPIAGDEKYGDKAFNAWYRSIGGKRLFLHAHSMVLPLSYYDTPLKLHAPLDAELERVLVKVSNVKT